MLLEEKYKDSFDKIRQMQDLFERMQHPYARLDETAGKRVPLSNNDFLDVLSSAEDARSDNGKWASVTYVKPVSVYKTKKNWRPEDVKDALAAHADRSEEDWYKNLSAFNEPDAKGKNPITTIVVVQRYVFHWQTEEKFKEKQRWYMNATDDNRVKHGLPNLFGDNHNQRQKIDGERSVINQTGNHAFDFNMAGSKCKSTVYLVDENGNVKEELPGKVFAAMTAKKDYTPKPEKTALEMLDADALQSYMETKTELDNQFRQQNFKSNQILCWAVNLNGTSYYSINNMTSVPIAKDSDVYVKPEQLVKIAEEQLNVTFEDLDSSEFSK